MAYFVRFISECTHVQRNRCVQLFVSSCRAFSSTFTASRRNSNSAATLGTMSNVKSNIDSVQLGLLKELCILVDSKDTMIKADTKENCHLMKNIRQGMLHRAFSVFLFNSNGELLLQQRSDSKITFPGYFTNTCCSHPLYTKDELDENCAVGVKKAAQRRLYQELGISKDEVPLEDFHFLTRIHYMAPYDEIWGEHEIDYVLFIQKDVTLKPNKNEVKECVYVSKGEMKKFLESLDHPLTPWFELIMNKFLFTWWDKLDNLNDVKDQSVIHRMF